MTTPTNQPPRSAPTAPAPARAYAPAPAAPQPAAATQPLPPTQTSANVPAVQQAPAAAPNVFAFLANKYGMPELQFRAAIKSLILASGRGKEASEAQVAACLVVARQYNLNPFLKEIHFFFDQQGNLRPIVGVDGWANIANGNAFYDGVEFVYGEEEWTDPITKEKRTDPWVESHVFDKRRSRATIVREFYSECFRNTAPWKEMPRRQLRHKAFIQGIRIALSISGIMDEDEFDRMVEFQKAEQSPQAAAAGAKAATKPRSIADAAARVVSAQVVEAQPQPAAEAPVEAQYEPAADPVWDGPVQAEPEPGVVAEPEPHVNVNEVRIAGVTIGSDWLESFPDWKTETPWPKSDKKNPLAGHSFESMVAGEVGGGRHTRLKWEAERIASSVAKGVRVTAADCKLLVALHYLEARTPRDDSAGLFGDTSAPHDDQ